MAVPPYYCAGGRTITLIQFRQVRFQNKFRFWTHFYTYSMQYWIRLLTVGTCYDMWVENACNEVSDSARNKWLLQLSCSRQLTSLQMWPCPDIVSLVVNSVESFLPHRKPACWHDYYYYYHYYYYYYYYYYYLFLRNVIVLKL